MTTQDTTLTLKECPYGALLRDVESMHNMCSALMKTKHYQTMGEAGIFAIVQKARSLGIDPLDALNGALYYVQGKVGMSSEMMSALIRQRGHSITKDAKSDSSICILYGKRADTGDTWTSSFSMQDAERAGLARNMYHKYPAIMLYNRAMSTLARQLFPDVIKGAGYTHDELIEIKNAKISTDSAKIEPIVQIEPVETITKEQADELFDIVSECDEAYKKFLMEFIRRPPLKIDSLNDLPVHLYERVLSAALKKQSEARSKVINENSEKVAS